MSWQPYRAGLFMIRDTLLFKSHDNAGARAVTRNIRGSFAVRTLTSPLKLLKVLSDTIGFRARHRVI